MPKVKALYVWDGANWQLARDAVSEATLCGGTLVVTYFAPTSRTEKIAHIDGNFYAIDSVTFCADSFSVFEATKQFFFVNGRSKVLQWMNKTSCDHRPSPQTVQGQVAFCIPLVPTELYAHDCKQLRTWGILGANGSWLIQPQFDGPFRFENGTATVLYYGQRRRINEKGEWVE